MAENAEGVVSGGRPTEKEKEAESGDKRQG